MSEKCIIDRKYWNVSLRLAAPSQLCDSDGFQCCLGFLGSSIGTPLSKMIGISLPSHDLRGRRKWFDKLFSTSSFSFVNKHNIVDSWTWELFFARLNDTLYIDIETKESWITVGFKELFGVDVEFINEYPKKSEPRDLKEIKNG